MSNFLRSSFPTLKGDMIFSYKDSQTKLPDTSLNTCSFNGFALLRYKISAFADYI